MYLLAPFFFCRLFRLPKKCSAESDSSSSPSLAELDSFSATEFSSAINSSIHSWLRVIILKLNYTNVTSTVSHRISHKFFRVAFRLAPCRQLGSQILPRIEKPFQQNAKSTSPNALMIFFIQSVYIKIVLQVLTCRKCRGISG